MNPFLILKIHKPTPLAREASPNYCEYLYEYLYKHPCRYFHPNTSGTPEDPTTLGSCSPS
jgi:hypothetical protein